MMDDDQHNVESPLEAPEAHHLFRNRTASLSHNGQPAEHIPIVNSGSNNSARGVQDVLNSEASARVPVPSP